VKSFPQTARAVFLSSDGLRGGWRFLIYALAVWYIPTFLYWLAAEYLGYAGTGFGAGDIAVYAGFIFIACVVTSVILTRLERRDMAWFGFPFDRLSLKNFGIGVLWGSGVVTVLVVILYAFGFFSFQGMALSGSSFLGYFALWFSAMVLVGFGEELFYRGYGLKALAGSIGFWPAALVTSFIFGGVHLYFKPMETVADISNIVLLGLFMCYSIRVSGTLWFAIGFHAGFDFFALSLYGSPNTGNNGLPLENHLLQTRIDGPLWLTGGPQGLEASWLMMPFVVLMALAFRHLQSRKNPLGRRAY
jgi:membrane protease YdiL (CAAX protease family)